MKPCAVASGECRSTSAGTFPSPSSSARAGAPSTMSPARRVRASDRIMDSPAPWPRRPLEARGDRGSAPAADLDPFHLAGQRVPVHPEEGRRRGELALAALQRLPEHGPVHLVQEHAVQLGDLAAVELVEELPEAEVEQLLERQLHQIGGGGGAEARAAPNNI